MYKSASVSMYLVESTHACDGADVVSDGDQCGSSQILLRDRLSLVFAHHIPKTKHAQENTVSRTYDPQP